LTAHTRTLVSRVTTTKDCASCSPMTIPTCANMSVGCCPDAAMKWIPSQTAGQRSIAPPDLVLSDVMMPILDGIGLLKALRAEQRTTRVPVILLSARAGEEAKLEGLATGADDYLIKPFSSRELIAKVAGAIRLEKTRREAARILEEENLRMRELFEQAPGFIAILDGPEHVFQSRTRRIASSSVTAR
jgi:CheY-like chemotaxis protein